VLVNNAAASLPTREVTPEGFERHWATNVLGPHLLTTLLLGALEASGHGRIVTVSTLAAGGLDLSDTQYERCRYSGIGAYRASKAGEPDAHMGVGRQTRRQARHGKRAQPRVRVHGPDPQRRRPAETPRRPTADPSR
jgi:retinol dehydrogenase 14